MNICGRDWWARLLVPTLYGHFYPATQGKAESQWRIPLGGTADLRKALAEITRDGLNGIALDLRNNPSLRTCPKVSLKCT
jgi:hypothetical protein